MSAQAGTTRTQTAALRAQAPNQTKALQSKLATSLRSSPTFEAYVDTVIFLALEQTCGRIVVAMDSKGGRPRVAVAADVPPDQHRPLIQELMALAKGTHDGGPHISEDGMMLVSQPAACGQQLAIAVRGNAAACMPMAELLTAQLDGYSLRLSKEHADRRAAATAAIAEMCQTVLESGRLAEGGPTLTHRLVEETGAMLVSIGRTRGTLRSAAIDAYSGVAEIEKKSELAGALREVVLETAREEAPILSPPPDGERSVQIDLAHIRLMEIARAGAALSVPLPSRRDDRQWVLTILWREKNAERAAQRQLLVAAAPALGSALDMLAYGRTWRFPTLMSMLKKFGPVPVVLAIIAWALTAIVPFRVVGRATLAASQRRVVAAPFDAVLTQSLVKPGALVKKGQVLALLDGRELRLERSSLMAQISRARKEYNQGLDEGDPVKAALAELQLTHLGAQRSLVEHRLANLEVKAPCDGVVLSDDLQRTLGVPVRAGQMLYEVAPQGKMVVEIAVPARDVAHVLAGQKATVRIEAFPGEDRPLTILGVRPESTVSAGENAFIADAELDNDDGRLRAGMIGEAQIVIDERALWWVALHRPIEAVGMALWRW